ncbi:hypothetical protein GYMLUDRAFT_87283 [Collybiopsis luxurians FD-317 M1]|uniref:Uncharacterized protein n=1 Tax=Collybiopsis luxurians FD-317 M1 TaxID=944289 RepID=A0A0D0BN08_9AGAR|nr:hypothetical protein GYMLUDRAFT_87283 [Collybiopsis luxurians FD-317 M1]
MTIERGRVHVFTGSSFEDSRLKNQAYCHPFTQQLDLIFPSNPVFENALETSLKNLRYAKGQVSLTKVVTESSNFVQKYASKSGISLLSGGFGPKFSIQEEDIWCVDHRGVLTLSVCKDTYDALGLVGKRVAFGKGKSKQGDGRHVISIPLYAKEAESIKVRAQRENALKNWEQRRVRQGGSSEWNVLAMSESTSTGDLEDLFKTLVSDRDAKVFNVACQKNVSENILIPVVRLTPRPRRKKDTTKSSEGLNQEYEEEEDWCERMEGLFEWVGMAGLGASRLKANDRVDSFVAVYEPPSPSRVGNTTHLQWTGFIGPSFVHSLIELVSNLLTCSPSMDRPEFTSLVSHACSWSPVSYISHKAEPGALNVPPPLRDPTREVEDSWCLIMTGRTGEEEERDNTEKGCVWALAESVGKYDTRFG